MSDNSSEMTIVSESRAIDLTRSRFNQKRATAIITATALGQPLEYSAADAGVTSRTVRNWLNAGADMEEGELFEFYIDMMKARRKYEDSLTARVETGAMMNGDHDWKASAWLASHVNPRRFGEKITVQVNEVLDELLAELRLEFESEPAILRRVFTASARALEKADRG